MSTLGDATLSVLTSAPPMSTIAKAIIGVLLLSTMMAFIIHHASPMRLTDVLVAAIKDTETAYLTAIEAGVLSKSDVHTAAMLSRYLRSTQIAFPIIVEPLARSLQIKVSHIREATFHNSLSTHRVLREFFKGRTFTVLNCIAEVRALEAHIEILKEGHLRDPDSLAFGAATRTVFLRQRHTHGSSF
ncbi:hypothetical protein C8R44DRAFT_201175 [Mycena epipterygia]|nr:hypothetical protein C8R44DRAFT_201175 [Mycena epipterygia]